ncbi:MAG: FAD-binding oxidoreductase [Silicimonas sp.]|nr:FAD-binding oxidoreductase [Silicimonas sp.]
MMLNEADDTFAARLSDAGLPIAPAGPAYLEEPRGLYKGQPAFVARPESTQAVAQIVKACGEARVGLVPYGGGTGLVAGQIHGDGAAPLILSLEKMKAIREIHPQEDTLIAEAGATIAEIQNAAVAQGRLFPLSYASQDSAQIGGALSVNSGGLNVLRYGMARALCLGVEAVLPDGQILNGLKRLRKDNTGYDLRHLLIGAEGTLGVITAASLTLSPRPAEVATAILSVPSPEAALTLLTLFRDEVGETVSAFELISSQSFHFLQETHADLHLPVDEIPPWAVLVELGMGPGMDPETRLATIFEHGLERDLVTDGRIAQSGQQRAALWKLRETIPEANRAIGAVASHDISLPLSEIPGFLTEAGAAITALFPNRINAFGHLGDGNLHYNVFPPKGEKRDAYRPRAPEVTRLVHDLVHARGGSFSAEHGLGRAKTAELARYGDPAKLAAMRAIKAALDPKGIMNPGAVLN